MSRSKVKVTGSKKMFKVFSSNGLELQLGIYKPAEAVQ